MKWIQPGFPFFGHHLIYCERSCISVSSDPKKSVKFDKVPEMLENDRAWNLTGSDKSAFIPIESNSFGKWIAKDQSIISIKIVNPMWDIFLFTGLLLISSSLLGLLPFMAVLWFISRSKDETFSHLLGSQKFTVYLVWMVVGAFMTHLFGGDIFPTYFKMIDDYLITISNSSWTNKTCLKYNQPLDTGDWNLKNFFYTKDYHGIFHYCFDCRDVGVAWVC